MPRAPCSDNARSSGIATPKKLMNPSSSKNDPSGALVIISVRQNDPYRWNCIAPQHRSTMRMLLDPAEEPRTIIAQRSMNSAAPPPPPFTHHHPRSTTVTTAATAAAHEAAWIVSPKKEFRCPQVAEDHFSACGLPLPPSSHPFARDGPSVNRHHFAAPHAPLSSPNNISTMFRSNRGVVDTNSDSPPRSSKDSTTLARSPRPVTVDHMFGFETYMSSEEEEFRDGEYVIVEGDRGFDIGRISHRGGPAAADLPQQWVVRRASPEDITAYERNVKRASLSLLAQLSSRTSPLHDDDANHVLQSISLMGCEFQFDMEKLTVYITMDRFVRFLPLAKALYRRLNCRVQIAQVDKSESTRHCDLSAEARVPLRGSPVSEGIEWRGPHVRPPPRNAPRRFQQSRLVWPQHDHHRSPSQQSQSPIPKTFLRSSHPLEVQKF